MAARRVTPEEAQKLLDEGYVYVDVRSVPEYDAGHPKGAMNVPLMMAGPGGMTPNADFLEVMNSLYAKDAKLVVGCKAAGRSLRAAEMLAAAGFTDIIIQGAGFEGIRNPFGQLAELGWGPKGLPVETTTEGGSYAELKSKAGK